MVKTDKKYFKAFIRVVKSINQVEFGSFNIVEERLIRANDKEEVKAMLLEKYPQFFPDNKVYQKETKDTAQFFYVVIFELYEYEKQQVINDTSWKCDQCGQKYENTYLHRPRKYEKLFGGKVFCGEEDYCLNEYKKEYYKDVEYPDDENYVKKDSPNYVYRVTEKATSKCYIGKTRNAPFFRWWNHLTHSSSPFGIYLRSTKLSDWTFEVLEILPAETEDSVILGIESKYIIQYDSIKNGFNTLISNKTAVLE
jgi:hypothetical protein